jgi:hypothetical protein
MVMRRCVIAFLDITLVSNQKRNFMRRARTVSNTHFLLVEDRDQHAFPGKEGSVYLGQVFVTCPSYTPEPHHASQTLQGQQFNLTYHMIPTYIPNNPPHPLVPVLTDCAIDHYAIRWTIVIRRVIYSTILSLHDMIYYDM